MGDISMQPRRLLEMQIEGSDKRIAELEAAMKKLLECPAIADGDLTSDVWGCQESAAAECEARRVLGI